MQPEHVAQIRKLVEDSPLLNQDERQEWLSLVELMNDKQLLELEKILTSAVPVAPKPAIPPPAQSAPSNAAPAHIAPPPPPVTGGGVPKPEALHLSHILNIPNASARPAVPPPAPSVPLPPEMEKIMEEKELPAGEEEKELPGKAAPAPAPAEPVIHIPEKPKNSPPLQPAPAPEPKPAAKPAGKEEAFTPGLNNPKLILNAQLNRAAQNAAAKAAPHPAPKPVPAPPAAKPPEEHAIRLASLDQIAKLTPKDWKRESAPAFVQSLRGLIKQFGYHDVMFSLEKSPLYKAYVDTGLTILKNQTDFAELAKQAPGFRDMYLMREDFESLADVLRQLPVG